MQLRDSAIHLNNNITKICHHKKDWWNTLMQPPILDIQNGRQSAILNFSTNLILGNLSYMKI